MPNHRGRQAIDISSAFSGIATCIVLLRLYTRFCLVRYAGVEDYLIILALICSIGLTVTIGIQAQYGMGMHVQDINPEDTPKSLKAFYASIIVYNFSLNFTKISILVQYLRVFPTKKFRISCWTAIVVVILYTIWAEYSAIFPCLPIRAFWTKEPGANCLNQFVIWFTNAGINIVTDLAVVLLPMPVIRRLNLAKRSKIALIGIFAFGGFVCVVSILRLQSLIAISNSNDPTYDNPPAATWSSVEVNVGIVCSCLPCLRPLLGVCLPGAFSSYNKYGGQSAPPLSRNVYGRHSSAPDLHSSGISIPLQSKASRGSFVAEQRSPRDIQVIREVHVQVENEGRGSSSSEKKSHTMQTNRSTDTLV